MQASLLTGLSCWAQRGSAFLCFCAQIMEPSIPSLEPVNRSALCDRGETNFKANQKEGGKRERESCAQRHFTNKITLKNRHLRRTPLICLLCRGCCVCLPDGVHPALPSFKSLFDSWIKWFEVCGLIKPMQKIMNSMHSEVALSLLK